MSVTEYASKRAHVRWGLLAAAMPISPRLRPYAEILSLRDALEFPRARVGMGPAVGPGRMR
jgi:hypothetical protein